MTAPRFAFPALLLGNAALAVGPWFVRLADVGPVAAAFWRLAIAAPFLLLLTRAARQPFPPLSLAVLGLSALGALFFAADLALWHAGIALTKLANATLFGNISTFAFAAYGFLLARAWPRPMQWLALGLAAAGTALLMGGSYELSPRYLRGDLLAAAAGICYTFYLVAIDRLRGSAAPFPILTLATLLGAPPLLFAALALGEPVIPGNWTPLFLLALSSQVLGQGLLVYAIGHLSPVVVGLAFMSQPVIAGLIGWLAYDESLSATDWAGAVAVLVALALVRAPARALPTSPGPA